MTSATTRRPRSRRGTRPSPDLQRLRRFGASKSDDPGLKGCGRKVRRGDVGDADEILECTFHCDNTWLCPVCGDYAGRDRFRHLAKTLVKWTSQGGSMALLTLTQMHCTDDRCGDLWDRLVCGWEAVVRGSGWRTDQETFALRGYVRTTEVGHTREAGWNVHFHVVLLLDDALDEQTSVHLKDRLTARFIRGLRSAGGQASWNGQHLELFERGSEWWLADYCTKGTQVYWGETSRPPMAILADAMTTGEDLDLWMEFCAAVTGTKRRRCSPSRGFANLVPTRSGRPPNSPANDCVGGHLTIS